MVQHLAYRYIAWRCRRKNQEKTGADLDTEGKFTIGRLAKAAGVGVATVRYYQRRNLLRVPALPRMGGYRIYSEKDLGQLLLIKRAQKLRFTLAEIIELSGHIESRNCGAIRALAERKLQSIKAQLNSLNEARKNLGVFVGDCEDCIGNCFLLLDLCNPE